MKPVRFLILSATMIFAGQALSAEPDKPAAEPTEEPATEEPATEEPATEEPATEEPATEEKDAAKEEEEKAAPALEFGDQSSQTLTTKAWDALTAGNHAGVDGYVAKCVELYESKALQMQASLTAAAPAEKAHDYWALNDVGTCYFVRAQSKEARKDAKGAIADYKIVAEKLAFAQCWDAKGWFWKPADAAKGKIKELEFDSAE